MLLKGFKKVGIAWKKKSLRKDFKFKNKWHEKIIYGQFVREMPEEIDKDLSWKWLVQSDLKMQTEAMVCAAQEQA